MIFDKISNIQCYSSISPNLKEAIDWIKKFDSTCTSQKDYAIRDREIYAFCRKFDPVDEAVQQYETHKSYIDIQYVLSGSERILCAHQDDLEISIPYDSDKDISFLKGDIKPADLILKEGNFAIFFPWDAHKPCLKTAEDEYSLKLVIKVAVES